MALLLLTFICAAVVPLPVPLPPAAPAVPMAIDPRIVDAPHVRVMGPMERALLADAITRSPTVAEMVDEIERSEVVVYLALSTRATTRGALTLVTTAASRTYLRVTIDLRHVEPERIAALAHELRHALEIARAPSAIRTDADLAAFYRAIGYCGVGRGFESAAAQAVEAQVLREVTRTR